jgi:hypothetical protein
MNGVCVSAIKKTMMTMIGRREREVENCSRTGEQETRDWLTSLSPRFKLRDGKTFWLSRYSRRELHPFFLLIVASWRNRSLSTGIVFHCFILLLRRRIRSSFPFIYVWHSFSYSSSHEGKRKDHSISSLETSNTWHLRRWCHRFRENAKEEATPVRQTKVREVEQTLGILFR